MQFKSHLNGQKFMDVMSLLSFHWFLFCLRKRIVESQHFRAGDRLQRSLINAFILQMTKLSPRETKYLHMITAAESRLEISSQKSQCRYLYSTLHCINQTEGEMIYFDALKENSVVSSYGANDIEDQCTHGKKDMVSHSVCIFMENNKFDIPYFPPLGITSVNYSNINTRILQNYCY